MDRNDDSLISVQAERFIDQPRATKFSDFCTLFYANRPYFMIFFGSFLKIKFFEDFLFGFVWPKRLLY